MELLVTVIVTGLMYGVVYAVLGLGLVLVYKASNLINLANGVFVVVGALMGYLTVTRWGHPLWVGGLVATAVGASMGAALDRLLRLMRAPTRFKMLIVLFGVVLVVEGFVRQVSNELFGGETTFTLPQFPGVPDTIRVGYDRAVVPGQALWIAGLGAVAFGGVLWFLLRTYAGWQLRAVGSDPEVAEAFGISVKRLILISWVISGAIGGLVGFVVSPVIFLRYNSGALLGLKALVVAIVGGPKRPEGALVAGPLLGLAEAFTAGYLRADLQDTTAFVGLILVLLLRPAGLLRDRSVTRAGVL